MKKVIALGFFDGVHLGHQALLERTAQRAKALGAAAAVCTFDASPVAALTGADVPLLTTLARREQLLRSCGADEVIVLPFDRAMRELPWDRFVTECLVNEHGACHLVCGADHRFGYRGEGTADKLKALCETLGLGCDILPPVEKDGEKVSSSAIRTAVREGRTEDAAALLGRPFALEGTVVHGKGVGGRVALPTANIAPAAGLVLPQNGVYIARVQVRGVWNETYWSAVNVGVRPSMDDGEHITVEAYLLGCTAGLYGAEAQVQFYRRLRGERRFDSGPELCMQMIMDAVAVREYFMDR